MENESLNGTPIGRLEGLDFYVYLYRLTTPRQYVDTPGVNTVGFGYVGSNPDLNQGMARINEGIGWLRTNIPHLKKKHGAEFPNASQYEFFSYLRKNLEMLVGKEMMDEIEGKAWIESNLLGKNLQTENLAAYLKTLTQREIFLMDLEDGVSRPRDGYDALMHFMKRMGEGDEY